MALIIYNGSEIQTQQINAISPVVTEFLSLSPIEIKYFFNIVTSHNVIKSILYDDATTANNARTAFIASLSSGEAADLVNIINTDPGVQDAIRNLSKLIGWYVDYAALILAHPTGVAGDYAALGSTDTIWSWIVSSNAWVDSGISASGDVIGASVPVVVGDIVLYNDTNGKSIRTSAKSIVTTIGSDDTTVPTSKAIKTWAATDGLRVSFDGQGTTLSVGSYVDVPVRFAFTITGFAIANSKRIGVTDAITIDVRRCTSAEYAAGTVPTTSIVGAVPIALTAGAYEITNTTVVGWTTTIAVGDWLRFQITGATAIQKCSFIINNIRA